MLDIFKSFLVKRTVRNGAICLNSHIPWVIWGQVMVKYWVRHESLAACGFLLLADKHRIGQVQPSGAL
jgi:hypothetical protein